MKLTNIVELQAAKLALEGTIFADRKLRKAAAHLLYRINQELDDLINSQ